jgi:hypothetical protein
VIGDILLAIKSLFKHNFCMHEYKEVTVKCYPPVYYKECEKCGRVK